MTLLSGGGGNRRGDGEGQGEGVCEGQSSAGRGGAAAAAGGPVGPVGRQPAAGELRAALTRLGLDAELEALDAPCRPLV